jgi:hypothetical protein
MSSEFYLQTSGGQAKSERIRSGLNRAKAEGREGPRVTFQHESFIELRLSGHSWAALARTLHVGLWTARQAFRSARDASQPSQNPSAGIA